MGTRLCCRDSTARDRGVRADSGRDQARRTCSNTRERSERMNPAAITGSPRVLSMRVIPVAGYDSMLLNLSGAHAPFFKRNLVLLTDHAGHTGAGEVPGGEQIREVLEQSRELVVGAEIGDRDRIVDCVLTQFFERDAAGRGLQTF